MTDDEAWSEKQNSSIFRSEEIALCQLFIQNEAVYSCVSEIGELGVVQFRDLNPEINLFQRKFVNDIRKCDEIERKLRFIEAEIKKEKIEILENTEKSTAPLPREIIELEAKFQRIVSEIRDIKHNDLKLKKNFYELTELRHVLIKAKTFLEGMGDEDNLLLLADDGGHTRLRANLRFVAGVINHDKVGIFEKMVWRACRGNIFMRKAFIEVPLENPITGEKLQKSVFMIFFQGEQLKTIILKICDGYRATIYPCPENAEQREYMILNVSLRLDDLNIILDQTKSHRHRALTDAGKYINNWIVKVKKMKAIYHILNYFSLEDTEKCLIAECWVPYLEIKKIQKALRRGMANSGSAVPPILNIVDTQEEPPTYNQINPFTYGFQILINSYGIACYREINPTPFTIISFPFLFAIMFGDIGHGLIMTIAAILMIRRKKAFEKLQNEISKIFLGGRYIIFLMGMFSVYTGFIYNDIFAKSLNMFGTSWIITSASKSRCYEDEETLMLNPASEYIGHPYPIGMDPIWNLANNKIIFQNSFKMKVSIIFGILHMQFGVFLSLLNHSYFKNRINIICEFIPQFIFLTVLFIYMVILMFIKWFMYRASDDDADVIYGTRCAPSILITFINMVLNKDHEYEEECVTPYMFPHQQTVQQVLVLIALCCVPWMLIIKPIILIRKKKRMMAKQLATSPSSMISERKNDDETSGEIVMHQAIHTIEFVLGSVSHTASYLRLWALSLAHAQLSEVLWGMVLLKGFYFNVLPGAIFLYIVFALWATLTVAILVLMEGLSAFLHTLRLHWVEFQSKFYAGTGYAFEPFSLDF